MEVKYLFEIQKKIIKHCATGMQPKCFGGVLHKVDFRTMVKGEIKWNKK